MRGPHKHRDIYLIFLAESPSQFGEARGLVSAIKALERNESASSLEEATPNKGL